MMPWNTEMVNLQSQEFDPFMIPIFLQKILEQQ
jgi:hypothetical protein